MTKSKRDKQQEQDEAAIMERMNKALKRMMDTPPETHKAMVERRRGSHRPSRKAVTKKR
jgi:hypothetical protein